MTKHLLTVLFNIRFNYNRKILAMEVHLTAFLANQIANFFSQTVKYANNR